MKQSIKAFFKKMKKWWRRNKRWQQKDSNNLYLGKRQQ